MHSTYIRFSSPLIFSMVLSLILLAYNFLYVGELKSHFLISFADQYEIGSALIISKSNDKGNSRCVPLNLLFHSAPFR